ncbi:hypothetical protein FXF50_09600 [Micromonospora sp. AP08]|uniref:hypothetical protein n=1 Tax=Micromonospora sp. AP08 TaxID=2604467 RepID=UPI0011DC1E4C|nr:hypothetical protein [Micromonospora sp. AP08]TYB38658.1 hypothetical protein FXF50_09600 [Micromonospora sp. AP08]
MLAWRFTRAVIAAASIAALALVGTGTQASAQEKGAVRLIPLSGSAVIASRTLTFTGQVQVITPQLPAFPNDPIIPPNPVREITILRNVIGTSADLACEARGKQDVFVPQQELDIPVTATYNLYPSDPVTPSPCSDFRIAVRYLTTLDTDGNRLVSSAIVTGAA